MATAFIGREAEQARLRELLGQVPLVTVTGPAGVGKTRLALHVLSTPSEGSDLLVGDLASLPSGAPGAAVAAELGFASVDALAASLATAPVVLLLDNCEHVLDAASEVVRAVLAGQGAGPIVATSREPLGVEGEHLLVLGPLPVPGPGDDVETSPAVRLFLDRSAAAGAAWTRTPQVLAEVAELCRRLDGLCLAIELAAARTRALTPGEILDLTGRRLDLLEARGPTSTSDRHRSIRAALDVSLDLLEGEERTGLRRLGVLAGPFTVDLAHEVTAAPGGDRLHTIDLLARLVDRSLVVAEPRAGTTRYRLLEVVRDRALEELHASGGADAAAERFVEAMAADADRMILEGLTQWSADLVGRITASYHHLTAALAWCLGHDADPARANRLLLPMFAMVHRSRPGEVLAMGRQVLDRWPDHRSPWHGEVLAVLATAAAVSGDPAAARELGERALADPDTTGPARVIAHRALSYAARTAGDLAGARDHAAAGRAQAASVGAASFERDLAALEATMLDLCGDVTAAGERLDWVVEASVAAADALTEVGARLARATLAMRAERWDDARADLDAAAARAAALREPWWEGALERSTAILAVHELGWAGAADAWLAAIEATVARGAGGEMALVLRLAASVAEREGHAQVARELLGAAPTSAEVSVLPDLFPDELRALEAEVRPGHPVAGLLEALARARDALAGPSEPSPGDEAPEDAHGIVAPGGPPRSGELHRFGDLWRLAYAGRTVTVRHLKGLADLAVLVASPGVEVHCLQLMGGAQVGGEAGPILDDEARRAYQARIAELQEDIDEAERRADPLAASRAEAELDALVGQLTSAFGLGGRDRATGSTSERARTAVTYRLRAAIRRITEVHPELGRHLGNSVRTGTWCAYRPETEVVWVLEEGDLDSTDLEGGAPQPASR